MSVYRISTKFGASSALKDLQTQYPIANRAEGFRPQTVEDPAESERLAVTGEAGMILIVAAQYHDAPLFGRVLAVFPEAMLAISRFNLMTPLHHVAATGFREGLKIVLRNRAPVDWGYRCDQGRSAADLALRFGREPAMYRLLRQKLYRAEAHPELVQALRTRVPVNCRRLGDMTAEQLWPILWPR